MRIVSGVVLLLAACSRDSWTPEEGLRRVAARLEKTRGLRAEPPPKLVVMSRAEWVRKVRAETGTNETTAAFEILWHALGIVPEGEDSAAELNRLQERWRGFYEAHSRSLIYITDIAVELRERQLAHALLHAVQHRHSGLFDLESNAETWGYVDDISWAWAAAREGEATLYERAWPGDSLAAARKGLGIVPDHLRGADGYALRWSYFPHVAGARYLLARAQGGLRAACDALYRDPPLSTEQVLHPERTDPPVALLVPDLAERIGEEWELSVRTVLGEWTIADWIAAIDRAWARDDVVAGGLPKELRWGGDLAQVYRGENGASAVFVWTLWDDAASAKRFEAIVRRGGRVVRSGKRVAVLYGNAPAAVLERGIRELRTVPFRSVKMLAAALADE